MRRRPGKRPDRLHRQLDGLDDVIGMRVKDEEYAEVEVPTPERRIAVGLSIPRVGMSRALTWSRRLSGVRTSQDFSDGCANSPPYASRTRNSAKSPAGALRERTMPRSTSSVKRSAYRRSNCLVLSPARSTA